MKTQYTDVPSAIQVLAGLFTQSDIFDNEKYNIIPEDFTEKFHRLLYTAFYNLHQLGVQKISIIDVRQYVESRPKQLALYDENKGDEYLKKLQDEAQISSFDYYYNRLKKFTLLRAYNELVGMNLSGLYDMNNILDLKKKQQQEDWLDNTPIDSIAETINRKIEDIQMKYVDNADNEFDHAGDGVEELILSYKENPEMGYPLYGNLMNTIFRGARLGKFYLRSGSTGAGKTRAMIADFCTFGCYERYSTKRKTWITTGQGEPSLFIATEQDLSEVQTMMLAFISDVNEEHILYGNYTDDEWERVQRAAQVMRESPVHIKYLPDFSMKDIENSIKMSIREFDVRYVCMDYIHTSMKMLNEVSSKAGIKGLREDNVLFMLSTKLKEICNEYGVFIMSGTQLNRGHKETKEYDQTLLRGATAIADRADAGMILLRTTIEDREKLKPITDKLGVEMPEIKMSIYKNRRGRWKDILLWCKADLGTCKIKPMFVTNYNFEYIPIENILVKIKPKEVMTF